MPQTATTTLREVMSEEVPVVSPDTRLTDAAVLMIERGLGALVVSRQDGSFGIISDRDLTRATSAGTAGSATVAEHSTRDVITAAPDWPLQRAAETMARAGFRHLIIAEEGEAVGMVSLRDLLRALLWGAEMRPEVEPVENVAEEDQEAALYSFRRSAKQHLVAASCTCELEWLEVLAGQIAERPGLGAEELRNLWASRAPCPRMMEPGGAD